MKKISIVLSVFFALIVTGTVGAYANSWITSHEKGSDVVISGCVIRFSGQGGAPEIHANAAHQCAGIKSVFINSDGDLEVTQTVNDSAKWPILFGTCQTDETLGGRRGMICGMSGGTGSTRFSFYDTTVDVKMNLNNPNHLKRLEGKNSNIWLGFVHAVN